MSQSALLLVLLIGRTGKPAAGPQRALKPRRRLLGRHGFRLCLQELDQQAFQGQQLRLANLVASTMPARLQWEFAAKSMP